MNRITAYFIFIGVVIAEMLGGWDMWLQALTFATIVDYVTGVASAGCRGEISSDIGFKGIAKKVAIFVVVAVSQKVSEVTSADIIRTATLMYYIANELISVLENTTEMGVPIPEFLKKVLKKIKDSNDKKF